MKRTILLAILAALTASAAANAHVTVQPSTAPAGGFARLDVRVPNERDDQGTVKVDVKLPPGILSIAYEPVPGWTARVTREKLAKPIQVEGLDVSEQVSRITWTGDGRQGLIAPGQFRDFGISVAIPKGEPGSKLTFKSLQSYQGGEVVRWIGPEDSDEPAPTITLTAGGEGGGHGAPAQTAGDAGGADAPAPAHAAADDGGSDGLTIAALVVASLALLAGIAGLLAARRAIRARSASAV